MAQVYEDSDVEIESCESESVEHEDQFRGRKWGSCIRHNKKNLWSLYDKVYKLRNRITHTSQFRLNNIKTMYNVRISKQQLRYR